MGQASIEAKEKGTDYTRGCKRDLSLGQALKLFMSTQRNVDDFVDPLTTLAHNLCSRSKSSSLILCRDTGAMGEIGKSSAKVHPSPDAGKSGKNASKYEVLLGVLIMIISVGPSACKTRRNTIHLTFLHR